MYVQVSRLHPVTEVTLRVMEWHHRKALWDGAWSEGRSPVLEFCKAGKQ